MRNTTGRTIEELVEMEYNKQIDFEPHSPYNHNAVAYISGAISGIPDGNNAKFQAAERLLLFRNYIVVNPKTLPHNHDNSWASFMKVDIKHMLACDVVFVLDDWKQSRGAIREVTIAKWVGIPVYDIETGAKIKVGLLTRIKLILNLI